MARHVYDGDNVNPIWSNAVNYAVGMLEDFTELTNLKFGNCTSCHRKGANLSGAGNDSLDRPTRIIGGGMGNVIIDRL